MDQPERHRGRYHQLHRPLRRPDGLRPSIAITVAAASGAGATTSTLRGVPDGLQVGHVYYYRVTACNPDGCWRASTQVLPFTVSAVTSNDSDGSGSTVVSTARSRGPPPRQLRRRASDEAILHGTYS